MESNPSLRGLNRRSFLCVAAGAMVELTHPFKAAGMTQPSPSLTGMNLFVAPGGDDRNPGTEAKPLRTIAAAQRAVRSLKKSRPGPISVYLRSGVYYLPDTIVFTPEDAGGHRQLNDFEVKLDRPENQLPADVLGKRNRKSCSTPELKCMCEPTPMASS